MEKHHHFIFLLFLSFGSLVASLDPKDVTYWQKRRKEAMLRSAEAYRTDFFNVTNFINSRARKMLEDEGMGDSRRMLSAAKHDSSCEVTNPMDACWRCNRDWTSHRTQLAKCALGFGKGTTGGASGKTYVVTDPSDNDVVNPKPGSLRHAVIQDEPLWITFKKDMSITLKQELIMNSHKTIDARGAKVAIEGGAGVTLLYVDNIIIHGVEFRDIVSVEGGMVRDSVNHYGHRDRSNGNAISIYGSQHVWIDHCSFSHCSHKFIDVHNVSTAITISNCHLSRQDEVFMFGAFETCKPDELMQVTLAYNYFGEKLVKNMPLCTNGICHVVNNDYTDWEKYPISGRANVTIISQGNRYIAPGNIKAKQVTRRINVSVPKSGRWRAEGDMYLGGAHFVQSGHEMTHNPLNEPKLRAMPGILASVMARYAGPLKCLPNMPC